jgi:hypothetical protein
MATSTFPAVKAALVAALATAETPLQVSYGHPGTKYLEDEAIVVGDSDDMDQEWGLLGARGRDEKYSIKLEILVFKAYPSQQEATERAFTILAAVETTLRSNINLGVAARRVEAQIAPRQLVEFFIDNKGVGWGSILRCDVRVKARI